MMFDYVSWESVATFLTGFLAVAAAVYVGRRQTKISEAQIELNLLQHRADLFDRRLAIADVVFRYRTAIKWKPEPISEELDAEFANASVTAGFLFNEQALDAMERLWMVSTKVRSFKEAHASAEAHNKPTFSSMLETTLAEFDGACDQFMNSIRPLMRLDR